MWEGMQETRIVKITNLRPEDTVAKTYVGFLRLYNLAQIIYVVSHYKMETVVGHIP